MMFMLLPIGIMFAFMSWGFLSEKMWVWGVVTGYLAYVAISGGLMAINS